MTYNNVYDKVYEKVKPKMYRKANIIRSRLKDYMKESIAGSQHDRITAFRNTINEMIKYINRHPNCSLHECLENIDFHWHTINAAKGSVYQWIKKGIITEFKVENHKLILTANKRCSIYFGCSLIRII